MKRRTICVLVMLAALLAAAPGWAAPAARVSSPVNQVLDWLGQIWRVVWATPEQPSSVWAETGSCVDPNGRPTPCPGAASPGSDTIDPAGGRPQ
jgi:hypothetical protein